MHNTISAIALALGISAVCSTATAATIAYEHEYTIVSERDPSTHTFREFQLFDPTLGRLTRATVQMETTAQMTANWVGGGNYVHGAYLAYNGTNLYLANAGLIAVTAQGISEPLYSKYLTILPGEVGSYDSGVINVPMITTPATNVLTDPEWLPELFGTGMGLAYFIEHTSADFGECLGNGCAVVNVATTVKHRIKVTYDYVPTAVPEPLTWACMLAGFALAGTSLRLRRRAPAAGASL